MAAPSVWSVSALANQPEDPMDAFLRNPRDREGRLMLRNRSHEFHNSDDGVIFREMFGGK